MTLVNGLSLDLRPNSNVTTLQNTMTSSSQKCIGQIMTSLNGPTRCFRETGVDSFGRPSMDVGQTVCLHHLLLSRFFGLALQPSTLCLLLSNLIRRRLTAMKARKFLSIVGPGQ